MPTVKVNPASTVAEIPTLQEIKKQEEKVYRYRILFLAHQNTPFIEYYRQAWGKSRSELSRIKTLHYFNLKERKEANYA